MVDVVIPQLHRPLEWFVPDVRRPLYAWTLSETGPPRPLVAPGGQWDAARTTTITGTPVRRGSPHGSHGWHYAGEVDHRTGVLDQASRIGTGDFCVCVYFTFVADDENPFATLCRFGGGNQNQQLYLRGNTGDQIGPWSLGYGIVIGEGETTLCAFQREGTTSILYYNGQRQTTTQTYTQSLTNIAFTWGNGYTDDNNSNVIVYWTTLDDFARSDAEHAQLYKYKDAPYRAETIAVRTVGVVGPPAPNVTEAITVGETLTARMSLYLGVVIDNLTVGETATPHILLQPQLTDAITIGELVTPHVLIQLQLTDAITIGEAPDVTLVSAGVLAIDRTDAITVGDVVTMHLTMFLAIVDAITIGEIPELTLITFSPTLTIDVADDVIVGDTLRGIRVGRAPGGGRLLTLLVGR